MLIKKEIKNSCHLNWAIGETSPSLEQAKEITKLYGKDIKDDFFYEYYINIYGERIKINYYEDSNVDELIKNIKNAYKKNNGKCEVYYYSQKPTKTVYINKN